MKNSPITLAIHPEKDSDSIDSALNSLFWKEPEMVPYAKEFLSHIREWAKTESPYQASDWRKYCQRSGLTQSRYSNMLKRLRKAGMAEKTYDRNMKKHVIKPSKGFSERLDALSAAWNRFLNL